jgi:hypothetical protein
MAIFFSPTDNVLWTPKSQHGQQPDAYDNILASPLRGTPSTPVMQPITAHGAISNAPVHADPEEDIQMIAMYLRRLEPHTLRELANGVIAWLNLFLEADVSSRETEKKGLERLDDGV